MSACWLRHAGIRQTCFSLPSCLTTIAVLPSCLTTARALEPVRSCSNGAVPEGAVVRGATFHRSRVCVLRPAARLEPLVCEPSASGSSAESWRPQSLACHGRLSSHTSWWRLSDSHSRWGFSQALRTSSLPKWQLQRPGKTSVPLGNRSTTRPMQRAQLRQRCKMRPSAATLI